MSVLYRVRTASVDVIQALIQVGANPNQKNSHNPLMTPLMLVLLRGASTTDLGNSLMHGANAAGVDGIHGSWTGRLGNHSSPQSTIASTRDTNDVDWDSSPNSLHEKAMHHKTGGPTGKSGHRTWIRAAETLIKLGKT